MSDAAKKSKALITAERRLRIAACAHHISPLDRAMEVALRRAAVEYALSLPLKLRPRIAVESGGSPSGEVVYGFVVPTAIVEDTRKS